MAGGGQQCGGSSTAFSFLQAHVFCEDNDVWNAMLNQVRAPAPFRAPLSTHTPHAPKATLNVNTHHVALEVECIACTSCVVFQLVCVGVCSVCGPPGELCEDVRGGRVRLSSVTQTNLRNNNNKFYIIQLLEDNLVKQFSVWMRWGRGERREGGEGEGRGRGHISHCDVLV